MNAYYLTELLKHEIPVRVIRENKKKYYISVVDDFSDGCPIYNFPPIYRGPQVSDKFGIYLGDSPNFPWDKLDKIFEKGGFVFPTDIKED